MNGYCRHSIHEESTLRASELHFSSTMPTCVWHTLRLQQNDLLAKMMLELLHILIAFLTGSTLAHMQLAHPPPFNASNNAHRTTLGDRYLQYPFDCCGPATRWELPCRGYHNLLDTQDGLPTASWSAGSVQSWSMAGIGNHYGGSCQVGFSVDRGHTFE